MNIIHGIINKLRRIKHEKIIIPVFKTISGEQILDGKIVMITGGTGGIGIVIAKSAIQCGAKVIVCGTDVAKIERCCSELGDRAKGLCINLGDCSSLSDSVEKAIDLFSENRIDILINAAGIHGDWDFMNFDEHMFDSVMAVNVKGTYYISQLIAKQMIEKGIRGHILNFASSSSLRPAWTPYQISKWAVCGMTKGLADVLLPYGIIVNAIAPGPTATPMVKADNTNLFLYSQPSHRYATPEEIANLAIFMVSPMGDMIVGDTYYITGGSGTLSYHT